MKITCIIVEDEPMGMSLMQNHVGKVPYLELMGSFSDPVKAIAFLRENSVDLMFSDIQMPGVTGISLLKIVQNLPLVIFTTAYSEYALEGYDLDVVDYLIKPISFERFLKSVEKAAQRLNNAAPAAPAGGAKEDYIFVKDGTRYIRVDLSDIRYIEGLKDYVAIHTPGKKIVSLQTMKSLEALLPRSRFIRIHNSYIVALQAIDSVDKEKVQIGNIFLPVSDSYKKGLREMVEKRQIGS